jgi:predicted nucleic acid-binding protein
MNELGIKSIMLDTSFCIRLLDKNDALHQNALDYFKHFLIAKVSIHLSTIAVAEYAVGDDPDNLPINNVQIEAFDFLDAKTAGLFHREIRSSQSNIPNYNRRIIANDVKILAQIRTKKIEGIISRDINSFKQYVQPLVSANLLQLKFFDLNTPLPESLGKLF